MKFILFVFLVLAQNALAQFSNESEYALVYIGGNSEVQTQNAKTTSNYAWDLNQIKFGGHYTYGETGNGVSARNWDINFKYGRDLSSRVSLIFGEIIEGNRFTGLNARYNSDVGASYYYIKSDLKKFFSELTYRYSIEDRYDPILNTYDHKARLYNEYFDNFSKTVTYKVWLEYIPNFTDGNDYLVNGEVSFTAILNSVFSLKVAYLGLYDNQPAIEGIKNYDFLSSTSLVAKF